MIDIRKLTSVATALMYSFCLAGTASPQSPTPQVESQLRRLASEIAKSRDETTPFDTDGALRNDATYEEHEFVQRINSLISALANFAASYHTGKVVDVKKAKAVRKALRDLEKSEWFKPQKVE